MVRLSVNGSNCHLQLTIPLPKKTLVQRTPIVQASVIARVEPSIVPTENSKVRSTQVNHSSSACNHLNLTEIPMDLPKTTKRLLLNDNQISSIPAFGLFNRLPNLLSVDLSRNQISSIEEGAFEGAHSIIEM